MRRQLARAHPAFQERLDDLPRQVGGCAWGAALIASILGQAGVPAQLVIGTFRRGRWKSDHCWAQAGGWILDWAAGQFKIGNWVMTPDCDPRYLDKRGCDMHDPAIVIEGLPRKEAIQALADAMRDWPTQQQASGEDFERFLARGMALAVAPAPSAERPAENVIEVTTGRRPSMRIS